MSNPNYKIEIIDVLFKGKKVGVRIKRIFESIDILKDEIKSNKGTTKLPYDFIPSEFLEEQGISNFVVKQKYDINNQNDIDQLSTYIQLLIEIHVKHHSRYS